MKKILSVLLAVLMLALPVLAMAEEPGIYIHSDESYGFCFPAGWTLITRETITELANAYQEENSDDVTALLETFLPQLESSDMVMMMAPTWQDNINITRMDAGSPLSADDLLALAPTLMETLAAQMPDVQFVATPELMQAAEGGPSYLLVMYTCELAGTPMMGVQAITCHDTMLYYLTLTAASADEESRLAAIEAMEVVLGTFMTL